VTTGRDNAVKIRLIGHHNIEGQYERTRILAADQAGNFAKGRISGYLDLNYFKSEHFAPIVWLSDVVKVETPQRARSISRDCEGRQIL
jgi:hypothetical protein